MQLPVKTAVGFQSAQGEQGQGLRKELYPFTAMHRELLTACISLSRSWWGLLGVEPVQDRGLELHSGTEASIKKLALDVCISVYTNTSVFFQLLKNFL